MTREEKILLDGLKISGNAEHVFRNRVLHHGTLLFDAELSSLSEALKANPEKYSDKAVRSVRSKVSNISGNLDEQIRIDQLRDKLNEFIRKDKDGTDYNLSDHETKRISTLRDEKYSTWEWNFGYSPKYTFTKTIRRGEKVAGITLDVVKGVIENISLEGDLFNDLCRHAISGEITGSQHRYDRLLHILLQIKDKDCFSGISPEEFIREMF